MIEAMERAPVATRLPERESSRRVVGVAALLGLTVLAAALAGPWHPVVREGSAPPLPAEPTGMAEGPVPTADPFVDALNELEIKPWDLTWLGIAVLVLFATWVVYLLLHWLVRHRKPVLDSGPPDDAGIEAGDILQVELGQPNLPTLLEGVADAGADLRRHRRPTDAVIAAWVRLERAAARSGVRRHPAATPTEFTVAVLDRTPADPAAIRTLLGLYLRARFGGEVMTDDDVAAAVAALHTLAAGLGGEGDEP